MTDTEITQAEQNLKLALRNDPRTVSPEQASEAYLRLTTMRDHRGDGIPTQFIHGSDVAGYARTLWIGLITALRDAEQIRTQACNEALAEAAKVAEVYSSIHVEKRDDLLAQDNALGALTMARQAQTCDEIATAIKALTASQGGEEGQGHSAAQDDANALSDTFPGDLEGIADGT